LTEEGIDVLRHRSAQDPGGTHEHRGPEVEAVTEQQQRAREAAAQQHDEMIDVALQRRVAGEQKHHIRRKVLALCHVDVCVHSAGGGWIPQGELPLSIGPAEELRRRLPLPPDASLIVPISMVATRPAIVDRRKVGC
jgi:hypothetical protein